MLCTVDLLRLALPWSAVPALRLDLHLLHFRANWRRTHRRLANNKLIKHHRSLPCFQWPWTRAKPAKLLCNSKALGSTRWQFTIWIMHWMRSILHKSIADSRVIKDTSLALPFRLFLTTFSQRSLLKAATVNASIRDGWTKFAEI